MSNYENRPGYEEMKPGSPLPPPIEPIKFVPGTNVQEQVAFVASKCNESINRWNEIQGNVYKAMNAAVGACVSNDVYYGPKEVDFQSGYSENDGCPYTFVDVAPVDKGGKPIHVKLALAYNNATNSGVVQSIEDASFELNSNVIMTAVSPVNTGWSGTAMQNGELIATTELADGYVCGFNKNGALRIFDSAVTYQTLCQNRMFDVIGPVTPIIINGEITEAAQAMTTKSAITALGYKSGSGHRIFFSCGAQESAGMQGITVAQLLQSMGCTTAVITSIMTPEEAVGDAVGGMEFVGRLTAPALGWATPKNVAFWQVSRRPFPGWRNRFEAEIADLVQSFGQNSNELMNIAHEVDVLQDDVADLQTRMADAEEQLENHEGRIGTLETEMDAVEARLDQVESRIDTVETSITELDSKLDQEIADRLEGDTALQISINDEAIARAAADLELAEQIAQIVISGVPIATTTTLGGIIVGDGLSITDTGVLSATGGGSTYTAGDGIAISDQNVISVDSTIARQSDLDDLEDRVDTVEGDITNIEGDITTINQNIQNIIDGTTEIDLPIATTEDTGVIKVGDGLSVTTDGTLSATPYTAGDGIDISENVVSVDSTVAKQSDLDDLEDRVDTVESNITTIQGDITTINQNIENIIDGTTSIDLPIASADQLGVVKIGDNLSITADGTLSATGGGSSYTAGDGIDITSGVISVDSTIARQTSITALDAEITSIHGEIDDIRGDFLPLTGGTMSGAIAMGSNRITGLATGTANTDAVNVAQLNSAISGISGGLTLHSTSFQTQYSVTYPSMFTTFPTGTVFAIILVADEVRTPMNWYTSILPVSYTCYIVTGTNTAAQSSSSQIVLYNTDSSGSALLTAYFRVGYVGNFSE